MSTFLALVKVIKKESIFIENRSCEDSFAKVFFFLTATIFFF